MNHLFLLQLASAVASACGFRIGLQFRHRRAEANLIIYYTPARAELGAMSGLELNMMRAFLSFSNIPYPMQLPHVLLNWLFGC